MRLLRAFAPVLFVLTALPAVAQELEEIVPTVRLTAPERLNQSDEPEAAAPLDTTSPTVDLSPLSANPVVDPVADPIGVSVDGELENIPPAPVLIPLRATRSPLNDTVKIGGSLQTSGIFRFTGETVTSDFTITVPDVARIPTDLILSLRSSIDLLPDRSRLRVSINGADAGDITLDSFSGFSRFVVPATGLKTGTNKIRLTVEQTHRLFCGPEASFALWSEIDLSQSGIELAGRDDLQENTAGFLAAIEAQVARTGVIEVLTDSTPDPKLTRRVLEPLLARLSRVPQVNVSSFYESRSTPPPLARIAFVNAATPQAGFRRGADGAIVLQVIYGEGQLPDLSDILPAAEPDPYLPTVVPGHPNTLASLGEPNIVGNTRFFIKDVAFFLPQDWLLLASQKATLNLNYGFSADLPAGALLNVKANGTSIQLLPLDRNGGGIRPPLQIRFLANLLHPGVNSITFEMIAPGDPPGLPCAPRDTDLLVILASSSLDVPPSPKMRKFDMSSALYQLGPDSLVLPPQLFSEDQNQEATLAFNATIRPLKSGNLRPRLHLTSLDKIAMTPFRSAGLTRQMILRTLSPPLDASLLQATRDSAQDNGQSTEAYRLAQSDSSRSGTANSPAPAARSLGSLGASAVQQARSKITEFIFPGQISLAEWMQHHAGVAMLLQPDPIRPKDLWLIATPAISPTDLARSVSLLRLQAQGNTLGQVAVLSADGRWDSWSANIRPRLLEPLRPGNFRTVMGNYASWSPLTFTGLILLAALLSVFPAIWFTLMTRRAGSKE
ncbi:cellulose biosynthesis cyclic di-GMP-binding regulatory protein BcsB [Phaeobacter sp. B1627]|uniref:cellulose biosynthesis cyclic di-GMP-binding regulatory protein BcsB n=1 Tax=Phaeobacter sp. B1627 TaxID=2583809 RepID=UPI00159EB9A5|nr:cellulose biosynthesis cyclic di-GMP-binding regulatory protein BcsB [Phaeobacter sp. B1627]